MDDFSRYFEPVREVLKSVNWPGVEESLSWGTSALKCNKKLICRIREPGVLVLICDMDDKQFLMASQPDIYFETDHYKGYPAVLIRLLEIDPADLEERLEKTWRSVAKKSQIAEYESRTA